MSSEEISQIKMRTTEEIMLAIEGHLNKIMMHSRILQAYKTPGASLKQIKEMEAQICAEHNG